MMKLRLSVKRFFLWLTPCLGLALAGCMSADPAVVARAVEATLTAVITPTPIVVVVTALRVQSPVIPTVTPAPPPAATPAPTLAPSPSAAPPTLTPPEPTVTASETPGAAGKLVFEDDFLQRGTWDLGQEDSLQRKVIADGWLSMTIKMTDRFLVIYKPQSVPNIYAQTKISAPTCHTRDRYGIIFRVHDGQNYYQFDIDCDGRYRLAKMVDGQLTPLVDWTANAAINTGSGAVNNLTVRAVGPQLAVSANGLSLAKVTDTTFTWGGFGFCVGTGLSAPYTAAFANLRVWETAP